MMDTPSTDYFRIEGATFAVKSGLWRAHVENDPDRGALGDRRTFLLRFDLIEPYGNWSGEAVRNLTLTTSRAALVIENLGAFLPLVVDGFSAGGEAKGREDLLSAGVKFAHSCPVVGHRAAFRVGVLTSVWATIRQECVASSTTKESVGLVE